MVGRLKLTLAVAALAAFVVPMGDLVAQDGGRFQVLIPYFTPVGDADDDFGKDASKELRELMSTMATHVAIEERDIKDEVKRFDMKIEDLTCITTRQLAAQIDVPVAICASYTENPDKSWSLQNIEVWDIAGAESFGVDDITVAEKDEEGAAVHIFQQFERYSTTVRSAAICNDYYASQQYENALRNCDESLSLNPNQIATRHLRGRILYDMERHEEALAELETVIEANPFHEDALQLAGYISALTGADDKARDYYGRYLEINPGNAAVRMNIAYDLATAGDPVGAMDFIKVGLEVDAENTDLWEQYGGFAFSAALELQQGYEAPEGGPEVAPEAVEYYREAIQAYETVFEAQGAETNVAHLRNIVRAYTQLGDLDSAISMGERSLQTHAEDVDLWLLQANALQLGERLDDAIAAIDRVLQLQPDHPNAALRQGNWLIQAGRLDEAVTVLADAVSGPEQADQAARMIFNEAYQNGYEQGNVQGYQYAVRALSAAKEIPGVSVELTGQLNFWHGFSIYQIAVQEQEPQSLESAQSALPKFQQAMGLLQQAGDYPASVNVNLAQLLENATTYVEIQEAIIKRGR